MPKGGKRPGAGRKRGFAAKNAEEARSILSEMVMKEIKPIGLALIKKAKKGDISAARELFDRAFGKAPQHTTLEDTSPIFALRVVAQRAREKYAAN